MSERPRRWEDAWIRGTQLGKGGQGLTHLVTQANAPTKQAAMKLLKNNKSDQARGRMHREVANLQVLSSAGGSVPSVLDHNTEHYLDKSVELFVVMDFVSGRTLREVIEDQGSLSLESAVRIMLCICKTIEIAHTFPILHRDLKPENIIARNVEEGDVVIIDYGLSFNSEDTGVTETDERFRNGFLDLPETNTPGGNRRDPRSDITAACGIFYYLLTGHIPGHLTGGDGRAPHLRERFSLKESIGEVPPLQQLETLFDRGFPPNIENRFQTIGELRDRIKLLEMDSPAKQRESPIVVAERLSVILRQRDRNTQLREFQPSALQLFQSLQRHVNTFANKLGLFTLSVENDTNLGKVLPAGLDRVSPHQFKIQLNPAYHNHLRILLYAIGSRSEQCVVLRQTFGRVGGNQPITPIDVYQELLWYDPKKEPDLTLIQLDIESWMNASMRELLDLVGKAGTET